MADETHELPTVGEAGAAFNPFHAVRSVLFSLFINGVCPYLLYRYLQPHYPQGSVIPLVWASIFPIAGLVGGLVRTRTIDYIAVIALFEISWNVTTALVASTLGWAMILRSSEGFAVAALVLILTLIGLPPMFYVSRQFAVGADPARRAQFAAVNAADKSRTFTIVSLVWVAGILAQTCLNLTLAIKLSPASYLLASQVISITVNVSLVVWTIRFTRSRLERVAESLGF